MNNYNPFSLEGKTILITGASSGIGRSTAIECSKLGGKCIITARNEERLSDTLRRLEGEGHMMIVADIAEDSDINNIVEQIPPVDGFVNNAGIGLTKLLSFVTQEDFDKIFSVNTFGPAKLTKSLLKKKKINKEGSIVITSSIATMIQTTGNAVYGMSKAASMTYARYLALELSNKKIRVNTIHPGTVNTEMVAKAGFTDEEWKADIEKYPLKRHGDPEEIAWSIIYLLSDASKWVTGTSLIIDGGVHLFK